MNLITIYKNMQKHAGWTLPAGSDQYLRFQNPSGNYNGMTTTPYEQTPFNVAKPATQKQPYGNPNWNNKPKWQAPEGYSNKGTFGQIGSNLKNWFKRQAWDFGHGMDTLIGTKSTYGVKRPTDESFNGSFWGAINPFGQKPQIDTQQRVLPDWQKRMMAESKGELNMTKKRDAYNKGINLPGGGVFERMAKDEALGQQYDPLRRAGYSPQQIENYVLQEKYLPLIRHATGKQNIVDSMQLTDDQMATIKKEMVNRQLRGVKQNLNRVDPKTGTNNQHLSNSAYDKTYEDALSQAYDARLKAYQEGTDPNKAKINYSDALKKNKTQADAVTRASQNVW